MFAHIHVDDYSIESTNFWHNAILDYLFFCLSAKLWIFSEKSKGHIIYPYKFRLNIDDKKIAVNLLTRSSVYVFDVFFCTPP